MNAVVTMTKNSQKSEEVCSTSDGILKKTKEMGGVKEEFTGSHLEIITEICEEVKAILEEEVEKMGQLAMDGELPRIPSNIREIVRVVNVSSIGTPEWVEIRNDGERSVNLADWTVQDSGNNIFTYPDFELLPEESVRVYNDYENTSVDCGIGLCWTQKKSASLWNNNGDTATLKNSLGDLVDEYCYGSAC